MKKRVKKILIISPEVFPGVRIGGLGKVTAGLVEGLRENEVEVRVVTVGENIYSSRKKNRLLGLEAARVCTEEQWRPDWVWTHDWGGVESLGEFAKYFDRVKKIWMVHSPILVAGYGYGGYGYAGYGYGSGEEDKPIDWGDSFFDFSPAAAGLIRKGISLSDVVGTVSRSFAKSLKGLELFAGAGEIVGINNGVDLDFWKRGEGKLGDYKNKSKLEMQKLFGLEINKDVPLFVFVARMVYQKGLDILIDVLPKFLGQNEAQFIFLGDGGRGYKEKLKRLEKKFAGKLGLKLEADFEMPRKLYAGADFLVLPSISEPYGLVVAEAKRYGVIPVVCLVDGLKDQVTDRVNGFGFEKHSKVDLLEKLNEALGCYQSDWQRRVGEEIGGEVKDWKYVSKEWLLALDEKDREVAGRLAEKRF